MRTCGRVATSTPTSPSAEECEHRRDKGQVDGTSVLGTAALPPDRRPPQWPVLAFRPTVPPIQTPGDHLARLRSGRIVSVDEHAHLSDGVPPGVGDVSLDEGAPILTSHLPQ